MAAQYPSNLQYFNSRLAGWSQNTVKVVPGTLQTADPLDVSIFTLPECSLVDLGSLAICGAVAGIRNGTTGSAVLPRGIESFVDSITVELNGTTIDGSCLNYNQLAKMFTDFKRGNAQPTRTVLQLAQDNAAQATGNLARIGWYNSAQSAATGHPTAPASVSSDLAGTIDAYPFALNNFLNFLGCGKIIDTSILGTVRIMIRWAPSAIVTKPAAIADLPTYKLYDLKMYCNVCDVSDGIYYSSLQARLQSQPLVIPFKRWLSFSGPTVTGSSAIRFSVSTQSLDAVYGMLLPPTASRDALATAPAAGAAAIGTDTYFQRRCTNVTSMNWDINSSIYPTFACNTSDSFYLLCNTFGIQSNDVHESSALLDIFKWKNELSVFSYRFNHSPDLNGPLSGLNSQGLQLNGVWNIVASGSPNSQPLIFAETTAHLLVGSYRSITLVA